MPNLLERGAAFLARNLKLAGGRAVTLTQGALTLSLTCPIALNDYEVTDEQGTLTTVQMHDWTIVKADLLGLELRTGARITDTESGEVYEVLPVGKRPSVERLDTSGIMLLVHSKRIT